MRNKKRFEGGSMGTVCFHGCVQLNPLPLAHSGLRAYYHDEDTIHGCRCAGDGSRPAFVRAWSARGQRL